MDWAMSFIFDSLLNMYLPFIKLLFTSPFDDPFPHYTFHCINFQQIQPT